MKIQDPQPIEKLTGTVTTKQLTTKVNELIDLLNAMWFTDETQHSAE